MTKGEACNWLRNLRADIGKIEHQELWHYEQALVEIMEMIDGMPSAERKGKWIYHPEIGWGETWLCDQCGEKTTSTVMGEPRANYCPNCGSRMERGEEND